MLQICWGSSIPLKGTSNVVLLSQGDYAKDGEHIQYNFGLVLLLLTPGVYRRVGLFREQVIIEDDAQVSMFSFCRQAQTIVIM